MRLVNILSSIFIIANLASCEEASGVRCVVDVSLADVTGKPVQGAQVSARYPVGISVNPGGGFPTDKHKTTRALTDPNGKALLSYQMASSPDGLIWIRKEGFYESVYRSPDWKNTGDNSWRAEIIEILKPIKKPIPMHAHDNSGAMDKIASIPELDKEYGYDLKMSEPLPPLGKGKVADFTFIVHGFNHGNSNYDLKLEVRFPNPNDGVVEFTTPQRSAVTEPIQTGSVLISGYEAPKNGYIQNILRKVKRSGIETRRETDVDFRRNFYFRTRTVTDASGNIVSAHYGKIYGDFQFDAANRDWGYLCTLALVTTYFNPTPNDRNVEFDPKRNLLPDGNVTKP
jgi:hypothetical protein